MTFFDSFFRPKRLVYLTAPEPSSPPDPNPVPSAPGTPPPAETPTTPVPPANEREFQNGAWPKDHFETSRVDEVAGQQINETRRRIGAVLEDPARFGMQGLGYTPDNYNPAERDQRAESAEGVSQETLTEIGRRVPPGGPPTPIVLAGVQQVQRQALLGFFERVAEEERREASNSRLRSPVTLGPRVFRDPRVIPARAQNLLNDYNRGVLVRTNAALYDQAERFAENQVYREYHYDPTHLNDQLRTRYYLDPAVDRRAANAARNRRRRTPNATSEQITEAVTTAVNRAYPTEANRVPLLNCINNLLSSKERTGENPDLLALKRLAVAYPDAQRSIRALYNRDPNQQKHTQERNVKRETESVTAIGSLEENFKKLQDERSKEQTLTEQINRQPLIQRYKTFENYTDALTKMETSYDAWNVSNDMCDNCQREVTRLEGLITTTQGTLDTARTTGPIPAWLNKPNIETLTAQLTDYQTKLATAQQQLREAQARRIDERNKVSLEAGKLANLAAAAAPFAAVLPAFNPRFGTRIPSTFVANICPPPPVPPAPSTAPAILAPAAHAAISTLKLGVETAQNTLRADPLFAHVTKDEISAGEQGNLRTDLANCRKESRLAEEAMRNAAGKLASNNVGNFTVAGTGGLAAPYSGSLTPAELVNRIITVFNPATTPPLLHSPTDPFVLNYAAAISDQKRTLENQKTAAETQKDRVAGPEDAKPLKDLTAQQLLYFVVEDMMRNGVTVAGQRYQVDSPYAVKLAVNLLHVDANTNAMRASNEKIARQLSRGWMRRSLGRINPFNRTMSFQDILGSLSNMREYRALETLARNPRSKPIVLEDVRKLVGKEKDGKIDRDLLTDLSKNLEEVLSDRITGVRIRDDQALYLQNLIGLLRQVWAERDAQAFSHAWKNRNILPPSIAKDAQEGFVRVKGTRDEFIMDLLNYQKHHENEREKAVKEKFPNRPEWQTFLRRGELTQHLRDLRTQMKDKSPEDRKKLLDSYGITSIPATISAIMRGEDLLRASGKFAKEKSQSMASGAWNGLKNSPEYIGKGASGVGKGALWLGKAALWPYKTLFYTVPKWALEQTVDKGGKALDVAGGAGKAVGKLLLSPVTLPISIVSWMGRNIYESGLPLSVRVSRHNARVQEEISNKTAEVKILQEELKTANARRQKTLQKKIDALTRAMFKLNGKKKTAPPVSSGGHAAAAGGHH